MDDIEEHLSHFAGKVDQERIDQERIYLSGLSKEEFEEIRAKYAFERTYEFNYNLMLQRQPNEWEAIRKKTSETNVLIYIYNRSREAFSLTNATWATEPGSYDIAPGGAISFTLPSALLRRISSGKSPFRSSQVSHQFTYRSGDYAFTFSTAAALSRSYEPFAFSSTSKVSRRHSIRSTGRSELVCEYLLEQNQNASPYSYAITIRISPVF